ncbi:MAG: universal stress protein [Brevundimonas sp.]|uniref:universal stress protein n=1 Tax=Brevundimonas sp. TaxID=1871086 RepID=UPI0025BBA2B2|nr:universal stress protein [Brevundimonas sp.]MBX3478507.1 universal stress protein [Brevundimonas sp.]
MANGTGTPPKRIVLATDLSGAGDRALDRATELAVEWDAELLIVHALDDSAQHSATNLPSWRRPPDMAALAERQIREDIRGPCPRLRFDIGDGQPLKVILDAVEREQADFLIVGMGRGRAFDGLSRTVDELFRRSPVSMLVVKSRPKGPYGRILVGTDYTDEARVGLEAAVRLFPAAAVTLMHAYDMPYRNLYLDAGLAERLGEVETATIIDWVKQADLDERDRQRIQTLIEHGAPEVMLAAFAREHAADLTVVGAYERGRLFHMVVGGSGPRIVQSAPGDVLVVRADRSSAA